MMVAGCIIWMLGYLVTGVYLWDRVPYPIRIDELIEVFAQALVWFVVMPVRGLVAVHAYTKKVGF